MPTVADYSILTDNWWTEGSSPNPIEFTIPHNINKDSRCILGFMFGHWKDGRHDDHNSSQLRYCMGEEIFIERHATYRYWQEVIPKGLAVPGTNRLTIDSDSGDYRWVAVSDVVLWWQADI